MLLFAFVAVEARPSGNGQGSPAFDRTELMERVESDTELLSTLVGVFKDDRPNLMRSIEEAISTGDAERLTVAARARTRATACLKTGGAESMRGEMDWRGKVGSA